MPDGPTGHPILRVGIMSIAPGGAHKSSCMWLYVAIAALVLVFGYLGYQAAQWQKVTGRPASQTHR